jgi:hypothetical protein
MSDYVENPFSDYGNIVRGNRFIGRQADLQAIENRITRPSEAGNLAVIGEPRIGKSSLVYKAIIERRHELVERKFLPVWINLATYDRSAIFFRSLVTRAVEEMEEVGWLNDLMRKAATLALEDELSWSEGYSRIQRFFERTRRAGYRILFVLDEFDHARNLFKGDISGFQGLRELSYRPEWRVTYITISRRTIRDIELQTQAISTFDGIFHKHYLGMFDPGALDEYRQRLTNAGAIVTPKVQERIAYYCGGHPYLLEMLGYEIIETIRQSPDWDVDSVAGNIATAFVDQYERMVGLLREDGALGKLIQIVLGPVIDVRQTDVDEFLKYGLIQRKGEIYRAFSDHFQAFLSLLEREGDSDLWPLWKETELSLRQIVARKMVDAYGEQWVAHLEKSKSNLKPIFEQARLAQQKEETAFKSRASRNLIDFTYPQDLFAIIFSEWPIFKTVFQKDKGYWDQRAQLLAKIRNPLAHNRDAVLQDFELQIAEGYCNEIVSTIRNAP